MRVSVPVHAGAWAFGYHVGVLLEPTDANRFSIHFCSKIDDDLEGDADFDLPAPLAVGLAGTFSDTGSEANITLPETRSLSAYREFNDQWAVMADATWTNDSRLEEIRIQFENGLAGRCHLPGLGGYLAPGPGGGLQAVPNIMIRAGKAYDESPIPNKQLRTARVPDDDRIWASMGLGYAWSDRLTMDIGRAHLFIGDVDTTRGNPLPPDENFFRGNLIGNTMTRPTSWVSKSGMCSNLLTGPLLIVEAPVVGHEMQAIAVANLLERFGFGGR